MCILLQNGNFFFFCQNFIIFLSNKKKGKIKTILQPPDWPQFGWTENKLFFKGGPTCSFSCVVRIPDPFVNGFNVHHCIVCVSFLSLLLDFSDTNRHISWFSNPGSMTRLANSPIFPIFPIFLKSPYISLYFPKFALCAKCYTFTTHRK